MRMSRTALLLRLLLIAMAVSALASLGAWQLRRGHEKQALLDDYAHALAAEPQALTQAPPPRAGALMWPVAVQGRYVAGHDLLLDNQVQDGRVGYDVWTPLQLDDGRFALIDRGWIARGTMPDAPPEGVQTFKGLLRALPEPGLRLAADNCAGSDWPRVVEYPRAADIECLYRPLSPQAILPGLVLLSPEAPGGFVRRWQPAQDFPPQRHYGYAVQWFALALTLAVLSLYVLFKSKKPAA